MIFVCMARLLNHCDGYDVVDCIIMRYLDVYFGIHKLLRGIRL